MLPLRFLLSRFISVCPSCRIVPSEISDESTPDPATRGDLQLHMSWQPDLHLQTFAKMGLDVIDEITHVLRIRHIVASDPKDSTAAKGKKRLTGFVRVGSRGIHLCLFQYSVQSIICLLICLCLMIGSKDLVISFSLGAGRIN